MILALNIAVKLMEKFCSYSVIKHIYRGLQEEPTGVPKKLLLKCSLYIDSFFNCVTEASIAIARKII